MSDSLRAALEDVRAHLESGIVEAEVELADARLRCRELRQLAAVARPVEGMSAGAAPVPIVASGPISGPPEQSLVPATPMPAPIGAAPRQPALASLPRRWLLALGAVARLDVDRLPPLLARNIIARWEGDNPIAGTHLGHAKALSFVRRLQPFLDTTSVRVEESHSDDSNVEIAAVVTLRAPGRPDVRVDTRLTVVARFDSAGMITLLFVTPNDTAVVDAFFDAATSENSQSA
jgi:hypothetical protein